MATNRFTVAAVFKAIDKVTAPVTRMQNRVGKFARKAERNLRKVDRMFGTLFRGIKKGAMVAGVALFAMGAALKNIIMVGADFGRAIGSAAAKFPEGIKRGTQAFKDLEKAARDVGSTTEFTSVEAAKGLNFLAKAGFSARFSMDMLRPIVDFATASELEFAEAADIASDALGAFGLDSDDIGVKMQGMNRVMDVMGKTANMTNTSVSELFEAVKKAAPVATAAGVNIETFSASMGFLAKNGVKATIAGTAAKNITLALAGVGNKAAKTFDTLGIKLAKSNGDLRDQFDVLDDLRKKMTQFGGQKRINLMEAIFGKISLASAAILLAEGGEKVRDLRDALEQAGGFTQKTAAFIRNDMKGSIDSLLSSIEGVKISILDMSGGPLKETIDSITDWIRANEDLMAQQIGEFITNLIKGLKFLVEHRELIGKLAVGFLAVATAVKVMTVAVAAFNLIALAGPWGWIAIGVAGVTYAIVLLVKQFAKLGGLFSKLKTLKNAFSMIGAGGGVAIEEGEEGEQGGATRGFEGAPQVITPAERTAEAVTETLNKETTERNVLDINLNNAPEGTTVKGSPGPGFNLKTGFAGAT